MSGEKKWDDFTDMIIPRWLGSLKNEVGKMSEFQMLGYQSVIEKIKKVREEDLARVKLADEALALIEKNVDAAQLYDLLHRLRV